MSTERRVESGTRVFSIAEVNALIPMISALVADNYAVDWVNHV